MKRGLLLVTILLLFSNVSARPGGIDDLGNNGCACHGGSDDDVIINITGLPEEYEPNISYNVSIKISSPVVSISDVEGGIRILFNHGEITTDDLHKMGKGWSQMNSTNDRLEWNLIWTAPVEADLLIEVIVHGNTVNGDDSSGGDRWASYGMSIPGPEYDGDSSNPKFGGEMNPSEIIVGSLAIVLLGILAYLAVRD